MFGLVINTRYVIWSDGRFAIETVIESNGQLPYWDKRAKDIIDSTALAEGYKRVAVQVTESALVSHIYAPWIAVIRDTQI